MRHLLSFECDAASLGASLDDAPGATGLLLVTGGTQTRIGSHRMYERLAGGLAAEGFPVFRFDRRGVGDSGGDERGFESSGPDIAAAVAAFRERCPRLDRVIGFGLCDGATALALFGKAAGLDGLILANPWLVEAEAGDMPSAAIRRHYRDRLLSREGWKRIITGSISYRKLLKGIIKTMRPAPVALAERVAASLAADPLPLALILSRTDATAVAAEDVWGKRPFRAARDRAGPPFYVETDSHTFARPGDGEALRLACLAALAGLQPR